MPNLWQGSVWDIGENRAEEQMQQPDVPVYVPFFCCIYFPPIPAQIKSHEIMFEDYLYVTWDDNVS